MFLILSVCDVLTSHMIHVYTRKTTRMSEFPKTVLVNQQLTGTLTSPIPFSAPHPQVLTNSINTHTSHKHRLGDCSQHITGNVVRIVMSVLFAVVNVVRCVLFRDWKRMTDASERLGQLLLQGWTMTEMLCPDAARCHGTPLMRPRNADHMLCVSCDRWFVRTPDGNIALEHPETKEKEKETPKPQKLEEKECKEKNDAPAPAPAPVPVPTPASDASPDGDDADASAVARGAMARLVAVIEAQSAALRTDADCATITAACRALEAAAAAYEALRPLARRA